jgi:P pilus assembly chaperone PapD
MRHDGDHEECLTAKNYSRNQSILIASYVEDGVSANQIGRRIDLLQFGEIPPLSFFCCLVPRRQRTLRIAVSGEELPHSLETDYVHRRNLLL